VNATATGNVRGVMLEAVAKGGARGWFVAPRPQPGWIDVLVPSVRREPKPFP
jgi:hypothetical protein